MKGRQEEQQIESVKGLIKQLSFKAWRRLPTYARAWIDLDDLIQESCARVCQQRRYYRPERGAWTNFVYHTVTNHLDKELSFLLRCKRLPIDLRLVHSTLPPTQALVEALESYERIYVTSSVELRALLASWIGVPEGYRAPRNMRKRFVFRERNLWRLRCELEAIVDYFKLSFNPKHVETLWASGRLQI